MPILEYYSPDTNTVYQFYARSQAEADLIPRCPEGAGFRMERMLSTFSVNSGAREIAASERSAGDFDPVRAAAMERLSAGLERLDESNPDPRVVGEMMREMGALMGTEKQPRGFEEMVQRLEAGGDLDHLEDQLATLLGDGEESVEGGKESSSSLRRAVRRDPQLHELRDYV